MEMAMSETKEIPAFAVLVIDGAEDGDRVPCTVIVGADGSIGFDRKITLGPASHDGRAAVHIVDEGEEGAPWIEVPYNLSPISKGTTVAVPRRMSLEL